ncbi:MAG: carboxypeptidase regulatory-like domain-containing protein, partial [Planctomycetes bacterium]|nr:carboxypeptidase regulatory-like domain-containing protein [Planctomycetota bacterium]
LTLTLWPEEPPVPTPALLAPDAPPAAPLAAAAAAVSAPGERAPEASDRAAVDPADADLTALRAATDTGYTGRVVTAAGEPVAGITVHLLRLSADAALPLDLDLFAKAPTMLDLVVAQDTTGAEGRFTLLGAAPRGWCGLRLAFADVAEAPPRFRSGQGTFVPVQHAPAPGEVVDLGDVKLKTGGALQGRVTGSDGPIAGAQVRAARLPPLPFAVVPIERWRPDGALLVTVAGQQRVLQFPAWVERAYEQLPIARATTGADGTFTVHGVDPGEVVVAVNAPAHASLLRQSVRVDAGAVTSLGDLALADGASPTVLVVDRAGQPVAGAEVFVAPCSVGVPVHLGEPAGTTGTDGKVQLDGLPNGRALAAARLPPDGAFHLSEPGPADGTLRVVVPGRHALLLAVQDGAGKALADVRVRAVTGVAKAGAVEFALFGFGQTADLGRRVQVLDDHRIRVANLDDGFWTFLVAAPGFAPQSLDVELREDLERTITLRPARSLRVRTIDAAGEPVAHATLHLQPRGGSRAGRIVEIPLAAGRTGADGWCTIANLPTEEGTLTAIHPRHGQVHADVKGNPGELVLQFADAAAIRGVLTDGGRPPAPGRWVLVLERRYGDGPGQQRGALPDLPQLALPDLEGEFTFPALQPGRYRVTAQDAMTDIGTVAGIVQYAARREQILPWNKAEVDLHGGETAEVKLDAILDAAPWSGPGAPVRGTVTVNGVPAAGSLVVGSSKQPNRNVTSRVDRGGGFDLGRVPAGALRVVVVPNEVAESRLKENLFTHHYARDLQVQDGQPLELRVDIETGGVFGEVRDRDGAPIDDCRVVLFDRGGAGKSSSLRVERSDGRGAFVFRDIPAGAYELRAEKPGRGKVWRAGVAVPAHGEAGPIAVVLVPLVAVSGRIETAPGTRADVQLVPVAGGDPYRATSEPGGGFKIGDVPIGSYRVQVRVPVRAPWRPAGELVVVEPATKDVVLRAEG